MAFFDDRKFLLSHIRHSFITCDDTGICERAMLNEIMPHHLPSETDAEFLDGLYIDSKSELEAAQSYDIESDGDMMNAHRRRSNTAQRLDRLKKERRNQAKIKVVHWKDNCYSSDLTNQDLDQTFPIRQLPKSCGSKDAAADASEGDGDERTARFKSALSLQIEQFPSQPNNPFNEYSKFDGRVCEGTANVKRISIFLTMLAEEGEKAMEVLVVSGAKVQDLIGLICWHYTNEGRKPPLDPSVARYSLRISEENGDVDPDFPSLNAKEPVAKFGFPFLALVEKEEEEVNAGLVVTVRINEQQQTRCCKLQAANPQTTLKWIYDQALRELLSSTTTGRRDYQPQLDYELEVAKEPGAPVNLNTPLSDIEARDFKLVRCDGKAFDEIDDATTAAEGAVGGNAGTLSRSEQLIQDENERLRDQFDMFSIEAPMYQQFSLKTLPKFGAAVDICLGVSGNKVDMNLTNSAKKNSHRPWSWQPKAISIPVETVADCISIKSDDHTEKTVFKIVYKSENGFHSLKFEGESRQVKQIVRKIEYCMRMRSSSVREEYLSHKLKSRIVRHFSHHSLTGHRS